ncbi:MAG: hypothetical protein ACRCW4_14195 [Candidatus Neomicrothrix subdominans]
MIRLVPEIVPALFKQAGYFDDPTAVLEAADRRVVLQLDPEQPLYGRLAAVVAPPGVCLLDGTDECWTVEDLRRDDPHLEFAHQADALTDESGGQMPVAILAGNAGHAPINLTADEARSWMDTTSRKMADIRYHYSPLGLVASGVLERHVVEDEAMVARMLAPFSLDARWVPIVSRIRTHAADVGYRLAGSVFVNVPGLPQRRRVASMADVRFAAIVGSELVAIDRLPKHLEKIMEASNEVTKVAGCGGACACKANRQAAAAATAVEAGDAVNGLSDGDAILAKIDALMLAVTTLSERMDSMSRTASAEPVVEATAEVDGEKAEVVVSSDPGLDYVEADELARKLATVAAS